MAGYANGANDITTADASQIAFVGDLDNDGTAETVIYRLDQSGDSGYDASHPRLMRKEGTGNTQAVAENISGLTFTYYDGTSNSITFSDPPTQGERDSIRMITISVTARTSRKDPGYPDNAGYREVTLTSNVRPRNFGL